MTNCNGDDDSSSDNDSWDLNLEPNSIDDYDQIDNLEVQNNEVYEQEATTEILEDMCDIENLVPKIGLLFQSEEMAYNFYNDYARKIGFSARKGDKKTLKDGTIWHREFVCSKQGIRKKHPRGTPKKSRPETRTDCKASIQFRVLKDGNWVVKKFSEEHNHNLASASEAHLLRSQRGITSVQAQYLDSMRAGGIGATKAFSVMAVEHGGFQYLNLTKKDASNYYQRRRKEIYKEGDSQVALNYFRRMLKENPAFSYMIQVDEENRLCNLFWADAKSKIDYEIFGDVVCFDTTFRTNKYNMPCAPIVGVDHHGMTVLFGCALLLDESIGSFVWLFESFLNAMSGKRPKTILTDQAQAISNAIAQVMPDTQHRLCLWHIYQNAGKHLSHVYVIHKKFKKDFKKCIYNSETEEEFKSEWQSMVNMYGLSSNKWLNNLYEIRESWAPVYRREHFAAGMTTTQRSESINSCLKGYVKGTLCVTDFISQYEKAVENLREKELDEDFRSKQSEPTLISRSPIERQASRIYTRNAFKIFQDGLKDLICYIEQLESERDGVYTYKVDMLGEVLHDRSRIVSFNSIENTIECSCKSFEFMGILCVHSLRVFLARRICEIPTKYFLKRWTKDAKVGIVNDQVESVMPNRQSSITLRYSYLAHRALMVSVKGCSDEHSSAVVIRHLTACLEELDRMQRDVIHRVPPSIDIQGSLCEIDEHITLRDPPNRNKKGESSKRFRNSIEKGSKRTKTHQQADDTTKRNDPPPKSNCKESHDLSKNIQHNMSDCDTSQLFSISSSQNAYSLNQLQHMRMVGSLSTRLHSSTVSNVNETTECGSLKKYAPRKLNL